MKKFRLTLFILFFCLPIAGFAEKPAPIRAELVADAASLKPGAELKLGVLFHIDPGWHIYWKNSGSSGLPTSITFSLPEGFTVGELKWPTPKTFTRADAVDYGYENSLLLAAAVKSPTNLPLDSDIPVRARVSWVSCEEVCLPGRAELQLSIPASKSSSPANAELFKLWSGKLPESAKSKKRPFDSKITGSIQGGDSKFSLILDWKSGAAAVEFIPAPEGALSVEDIAVRSEGGKTRITFTARVYSGQKLSSGALEALVAYTDERGERRGAELFIPLNAKSKL